jgi:prophage regulatory protein
MAIHSINHQTQPVTLPETGYIRLKQLLKIVPFSSATVWRKCKNGSFPSPIKLSDRVTAWSVKDINEWMLSKEAA